MFLRVSSAINMLQTALSCCPQHAASTYRHVDNAASPRTASAKEMAMEIVVLLGRNWFLSLNVLLLVL